MAVRTGDQKTLGFMLFYNIEHLAQVLGMKDFTFTELNIFLKLKGNGFRHAEIFHGFRNLYPDFFGNAEEMIYSMLAVKNNRREFIDIDFFIAEFTSRHTFYFEEFMKFKVYAIFPDDVAIRRFFNLGRNGL